MRTLRRGAGFRAKREKKYGFGDDTWERLGNDDQPVERIEAEKVRRIRDGSFKRERSQQLVTKAPDVLDGIMSDPKANAKHRIDASKVLDDFAATGPTASEAGDRVIVTINLGADTKLTFNKSLRPDPNDGEIIDATPQELLPIIAANKRTTDGGNGNAL